MAVRGITHKFIIVGRIQQMKKLSVVFIIIFSVFCSACSSSKSFITKEEINGAEKNVISVDNKEAKESIDSLQTKQVEFPDCKRYKALIERARMAIGCSEKEYLAGWNDNFTLQSDGSLWMWSSWPVYNNEPRAKKILDDVVDFAANGVDLLIIKSDASLWIWERDLVDGSLKGEPIYFMDNVVDVSNACCTSLAIQLDGSLWTWESIQEWKGGNGRIVERQKPVKIMEDVVSISISQSNFGIYAMAIQLDGSLWAWGDNSAGQLGDGTIVDRQEPVKVMENVVNVSTTEVGTSMALGSDGSLWAWGDYINGLWGGCPRDNSCNPIKVFDDVVYFSINSKWGSEALTTHILAVKSDGSLWGWGGNTCGELGLGNTECSAEPMHIMDDIVYAYAFSENFTMAVDIDDNVWFMGRKEKLFGEQSLYPNLIDIRNLPCDDELSWMVNVGRNRNTWGIVGYPSIWIGSEESDLIGKDGQCYFRIEDENKHIVLDVGLVNNQIESFARLFRYDSGNILEDDDLTYEKFLFNDGNVGLMVKNKKGEQRWINGSVIMGLDEFYLGYDEDVILDIARTLCDRNRNNSRWINIVDKKIAELSDSSDGTLDLKAIDTDKVRDYKIAYREKVKELTAEEETASFSLIYLTGSDIPELVAEHSGYDVSVFAWVDGKIITLMDQWPYGAGGNTGYEYLPGNNIIRNYDMDYAGAVIYESYLTVNDDYEVVELLDEGLSIWYFRDINGDGMIDEDEYCDEPIYYYGDSEISEEEYAAYQVRGDFDMICGEMSTEEIMAQLESDVMGSITDDSAPSYYEPIEDYWKLSGSYSDSTGGLSMKVL